MSLMLPGFVSTVIPVYNRPGLIAEAVDCVLRQTYRSIEVIVVDDGSTDETAAVCERLAREHPDKIRIVHQNNAGPGVAREAGRQEIRGEFVQYLDSDDYLHPRKFELQVNALRADPQADIAYCKTDERPTLESPIGIAARRTGECWKELFPVLLSGRLWHTMTPLFRRSITDRIGPWSPLTNEEDWEYDARAAALGSRLAWCPQLLAHVRHHDGPRASQDSLQDSRKMASRAEAHRLIYLHAIRAGITPDDPHMQHFARELFLLARQCGLVHLSEQAKRLFDLAVEASGPRRGRRLDFRAYRLLARSVGWSNAGRLACKLDALRPRRDAN